MFKMACNAYGNFVRRVNLIGKGVNLSDRFVDAQIAQPFYKLCSDVQRKFMLAELQPWVAFLSKDKFGCRVLQTVRSASLAVRCPVDF